jgi:hypothetical protein
MSIQLGVGSRGEEVKLLQTALNELGGYNLANDGVYGNGTRNALIAYQNKVGAEATGIYNSQHMPDIAQLIDFKYIRYWMIDDYAKEIGIEPAFLKAVTNVESKGYGFFPNGSCVILFERHIFYQRVASKFGVKRAQEWMDKYPNVCHNLRSQSAYFGGMREWDRLNLAKNLDPECALLSASWGMFQIMGFNYKVCGYDDVGSFVSDMCETERYQVGAVAMFIRNQPHLWNAARKLDFAAFAKGYNGAAYAENAYDRKLRDAYNYYKG